LIVLWVIAFLSFLIVTGMMVTSQDVETLGARKLTSRARQLAEMGVAVAAHPRTSPWDAILRRDLSSTERYEARLTSEESRIHLNAMLTEENHPVLERLFQSWGMQPADAQTLVGAMMDWVDAGDLPRLNSAERAEYEEAGFPGRPSNGPFRSLDEVAWVAGMDQLMALRPHWRDTFTLWGRGRLDVNEAGAENLEVVTGLPMGLVEMLVQQRSGSDGVLHTGDDQPFRDIDDVTELLGLSEEEGTALADRITVESQIARIESVGRVGDHARGIVVVLKKNGTKPTLLEWREFVPRGPQR
jgi:type II secretory pathway component PulK